MSINFKQIKDPEEYLNLVQQYSYLVDKELSAVESRLSELTPEEIAKRLPKFISLVNVIGYLRGQDSVFSETRPEGITFQKDLYANEDNFEGRLQRLIDIVNTDSDATLLHRERLNEYYLESRGLRGTDASYTLK